MALRDRRFKRLPARDRRKIELAHGIAAQTEMQVCIDETRMKNRTPAIQNSCSGWCSVSNDAVAKVDIERLTAFVQSHVSKTVQA